MKALYKYSWSWGRHGTVRGLFVAHEDEVKAAIGRQVYFGEILGKHSEVSGQIEESHFEKITTEPEVIRIFEEYKISSGYNPLDYVCCPKCDYVNCECN